MADINDLATLMQSVDVQIKEQTQILRSILTLQEKEAGAAERRWQLSRADRDVVPPSPGNPPDSGPGPGPGPGDADNTLSGLLGGLASLFGGGLLTKFGVLAAGATALAASIAVSIGLIKGQMTAIEVFFKAFAPGLVKIFDDFKLNLSTKFTAVAAVFTSLIDDLKIRVAFIRVAVTEAFDSFSNNIKGMFSAGPDSRFTNVINSIRNSLNVLIEPFRTALTTIQELASPEGPPGRIASIFKTIKTWLGSLGAQIGRIASVVGKVFAPIAIIMTVWDTIKGALDGYAEGGFLGGLKGAIDGFFTSLITVPLDLVKNLVAWVLGKLGFDESAEALQSFSFTDLWKQLTGAIFSGIEGAINVIKDLFTFGEEDKTALGLLGKLTDLVYAPVNMAINFVRGLFGFEETDEPFKLQDWISEKATAIFSWLGIKFSEFADYVMTIPEQIKITAQTMWIDVKEKLKLGFLDLAEWLTTIPKKMLAMVMNVLGSVQFTVPNWVPRIGGETLRLVDQEDVDAANAAVNMVDPAIAERRAAIIDTANSERSALAAELRQIEERAIARSQPQPIVISAPNNSQTNVNSRGGQSSTVVNAFGSSRSDLDMMSRPAGAF
jgi:hypothetical protein